MRYFCVFNKCRFYTDSENKIRVHIDEQHGTDAVCDFAFENKMLPGNINKGVLQFVLNLIVKKGARQQ